MSERSDRSHNLDVTSMSRRDRLRALATQQVVAGLQEARVAKVIQGGWSATPEALETPHGDLDYEATDAEVVHLFPDDYPPAA